MTKQDKIGATLRKFDAEWSKKSKSFCQIVKEFTKGNLELTDDEIIQNIKDIFPDEKQIKD